MDRKRVMFGSRLADCEVLDSWEDPNHGPVELLREDNPELGDPYLLYWKSFNQNATLLPAPAGRRLVALSKTNREGVLIKALAETLGLHDDEVEALELRATCQEGLSLRVHNDEWLSRRRGGEDA